MYLFFSDRVGLLNKYTFIYHILLVNIDDTDNWECCPFKTEGMHVILTHIISPTFLRSLKP